MPVKSGNDDNKTETHYWLALIRAPVGPVHAARFVRHFGGPAELFDASSDDWSAAGIPQALQAALRAVDWAGVEQDLRWLDEPARELITCDDPRYPAALRAIAQAPLALFCHGDASLLARPQLAIVGARAASPRGLETAADFAGELTRRGLLVSSGLALGIDGAAHRGALDAGGPTIAVCGTGLDRVYPSRHRELAHRIGEHGVLVSEFPTGVGPLGFNFPRRNRILSGLSLGVLVVEAAMQSGSLVTAKLALEQGREVFAIPGSIHQPTSRGVHWLIRNGAKLTENVDDILEEIAGAAGPALRYEPRPPAAAPTLEPAQQRVLDALGHDVTSFDRLVERLEMPVSSLSAVLMALELQGRIASAPGGAFQRLGRN
ncbi:MAG TPA: DNA-processing protein DprA [Verrucomicrobiae bacterium]|nr:DNA-processing protein DprA [Verrucomicrobiae bacterium]